MRDKRVIRSAFTQIPRYTSSYTEPVNWTLFRLWDLIPLGVVVLAVDPLSDWFMPLLVLASAWLCVRLGLRLRRRAHYCADHGHDPYRPIPELAEYRCFRCDQPLDYTSEAASVDEIVDAVRRSTPENAPQARWSDRR